MRFFHLVIFVCISKFKGEIIFCRSFFFLFFDAKMFVSRFELNFDLFSFSFAVSKWVNGWHLPTNSCVLALCTMNMNIDACSEHRRCRRWYCSVFFFCVCITLHAPNTMKYDAMISLIRIRIPFCSRAHSVWSHVYRVSIVQWINNDGSEKKRIRKNEMILFIASNFKTGRVRASART